MITYLQILSVVGHTEKRCCRYVFSQPTGVKTFISTLQKWESFVQLLSCDCMLISAMPLAAATDKSISELDAEFDLQASRTV